MAIVNFAIVFFLCYFSKNFMLKHPKTPKIHPNIPEKHPKRVYVYNFNYDIIKLSKWQITRLQTTNSYGGDDNGKKACGLW